MAHRRKMRKVSAVCAACALAMVSGRVRGDDFTWTNNSGSNNWEDGVNWQSSLGQVVPGANDTAHFVDVGTPGGINPPFSPYAPFVNDADAVNTLSFDNAAVSADDLFTNSYEIIGGATLTLNTIVNNVNAPDNSIEVDVQAANNTLSVMAFAPLVEIDGNITANLLDVEGGGGLIVSAQASNIGAIHIGSGSNITAEGIGSLGFNNNVIADSGTAVNFDTNGFTMESYSNNLQMADQSTIHVVSEGANETGVTHDFGTQAARSIQKSDHRPL